LAKLQRRLCLVQKVFVVALLAVMSVHDLWINR
jgi:hypothetical protein